MRISLIAVFLAVAACSSHNAEHDGTDEGATEIKPHGTDAPAKVVVVLPDGAPSTVEARVTVDQGPTKYKLGESIPVSVGTHQVTVTSEGSAKLSTTVTIDAVAGQDLKLHASIIIPDAIHIVPTVGLEPPAARITSPGIDIGVLDANGANAFPVVGNVVFRYGLGRLDGTQFDVPSPVGEGQGAIIHADVTEPQQRLRAVIRAPSSRDLPDVQCNGEPVKWTLRSDATTDRAQFLPVPDRLGIDVGLAQWQAYVPYRFGSTVLDEISGSAVVELGMPGGATGVFEVGRIDVADVQMPDGRTVQGTFEIRRNATAPSTQSANLLRCEAVTGHGVDVPFGEYEIRTTYQTVESGLKTDVQTVTVP